MERILEGKWRGNKIFSESRKKKKCYFKLIGQSRPTWGKKRKLGIDKTKENEQITNDRESQNDW